jgi:hypothetical protein
VTLRALPPCSLAVSYAPPEEMWQPEIRAASATFREMAIAAAEPVISLFAPSEFSDLLADTGFAVVEDVGPEDVEARYGVPALSLGQERIAHVIKE